MSNPVVTIGNVIPMPPDPEVERITYTEILFEDQEFLLYEDGVDDSSYDPSNMGQNVFIGQRMGFQTLTPTRPTFVAAESWKSVKAARSAFLTANHSVMPKLILPSEILVDNGIQGTTYDTYAGFQGDTNDLFNWKGITANGVSIASGWAALWYKYLYAGGYFGSLFVTTRHKDDTTASNSLVLEMNKPSSPPVGEWVADDLVVQGAFVLMLNVVPTTSGHDSSDNANKNTWGVKVECGDIVLELSDGGCLKATINSGDKNTVAGNLAEGKTKEGVPQQKHVVDREPYIIVVFPVWNGIVVMSGQQEARGVQMTASTLVKKFSDASTMVGYSSGFDPAYPAEVEVDIGTPGGPDDLTVDFGDKMTVTGSNCRFDLAYLPCFFSMKAWFDQWFIGNDTSGSATYTYDIYPIWTANGTDYALDPMTINTTGYQGPVADTSWKYVKWRLERATPTEYLRHAGEVFGAILRIKEENTDPIDNDNGSFVLGFTPVEPGNPGDGNWKNYVQSVQVTVGVDGSSGSITVDKYGVAGTGAVATQSIGAVTLDATGGPNTVPGSIFQGLGMGIGDSEAAGSSTWTIPLVGQEKKLDDILLISPPFVDGWTLADAMKFLARYAGIKENLTWANGALVLTISSDINVPIFDWKSGTSVRSAIEDVMNNTLHSYVVRDGEIWVYELTNAGIPVHLGQDWQVSYPNVSVVSIDKTPDFSDLRNKIVAGALEEVPEGKGTEIGDIPIFPMIEIRDNITVPPVPWAMCWFQPASGTTNRADLGVIADRLAAKSRMYSVEGSVTIEGNADIRPYDKWGVYIIMAVTHNMDMQAKTWTTSMELGGVA